MKYGNIYVIYWLKKNMYSLQFTYMIFISIGNNND